VFSPRQQWRGFLLALAMDIKKKFDKTQLTNYQPIVGANGIVPA
jgi:hypothetical protein